MITNINGPSRIVNPSVIVAARNAFANIAELVVKCSKEFVVTCS
jgi:hypothetical protein